MILRTLTDTAARFVFVLTLAGCLTLFPAGCSDRTERFLEQNAEEADLSDIKEPDISEPGMDGTVTEAPDPVPADIYVDVCGAVVNPGVYVLPEGSRVYQAIEAAGGFAADAAPVGINQAELLTDAVQIFVPTEDELESTPVLPAGTAETAGTSDGRIDLNTAGMDELTTLPGIGESKASAILSYREKYGPFGSVEELMQVNGIKEGTFAKIKDQLAVY